MVDLIKAVASQLIVWHHFAAYGPMARTLRPYAPGLMEWLYADARQLVQAFLVVGGFLAVRSLAPRPDQPCCDPSIRSLAGLAWRRYVRLMRPYGVALLLAIVSAMLARAILADIDTPAVPSWQQLAVHLLLLNDFIQVDALSAGIWYVGIVLQLYCVLLGVLWLSQALAGRYQIDMRRLALWLVVGLSTASLLWFNRNPAMDEWAFYFFGAYGLGVMVQWSGGFTRKHPWLTLMLAVFIVALELEWRTRLVVAASTALLLGIGVHAPPIFGQGVQAVMAWLSRISYSVFLIHYPVVLIVGAIIARIWPDVVAMHVVGLMLAWLLSLAAGTVLYHQIEAKRPTALKRHG
jgi:peptidoglycan/LPS O-acetylase OafA/YrhL